MTADSWPTLPSRSTLLAVGASLGFVGIMLRGFAQSNRRAEALRKQHQLSERKSTEAALNEDFIREPGWLERNLGWIANGLLALGAALTLTALAQH